MHALIYASFGFLLISSRATAKPIAIDSDFSTDYSLFTGDDGELLGTGDDSDIFSTGDNLPDLSAADPACSEVSLSNDYDSSLGLDSSLDLLGRDLDDTLLAGKKPATCVNPNRSDDKKLQLPQFEMLVPIDESKSGGKCNTYGQDLLACCDNTADTSPLNCVPWPFVDCGQRWEYCCREILANGVGNNCLKLEGPIERMIHNMGYPANWEEMPVRGPLNQPTQWTNPWHLSDR